MSSFEDSEAACIHLKNYRDLIRRMVGEQPVQSFAPRSSPLPPSVYYDGANDRPAFDNWLRTLLLYFRAFMMCGEEHDDLRVTTAARYLEGIAKDWFFVRVTAPGSSIPYKFEEVVIEMAQVFLALGSPMWPGRLPRYIPGTTARAFYFQIRHQYEMDPTFGTELGPALIPPGNTRGHVGDESYGERVHRKLVCGPRYEVQGKYVGPNPTHARSARTDEARGSGAATRAAQEIKCTKVLSQVPPQIDLGRAER